MIAKKIECSGLRLQLSRFSIPCFSLFLSGHTAINDLPLPAARLLRSARPPFKPGAVASANGTVVGTAGMVMTPEEMPPYNPDRCGDHKGSQ